MKSRAALWILLLLCSFTPFPSFSQPLETRPGPGMGMRPWRGEDPCWKASDLTLSADQSKGLELAQRDYFRETQVLRAEIISKRLEIRDFLRNPSVKTELIRSKQSEINALQSKLDEKTIDYLVKVRSLLTQEQLRIWCPEMEFPFFRRMTQRPDLKGPINPRRVPPPERFRED